ncbi:MAG: hypothetical protein ABIZ07_11045 [Dermatophilaceae bacterium]
MQTPGYKNAGAARDDINTLLKAWKTWNGDSWDLATGLVAVHEVLTPRLAMMAGDVAAALDGDETMQEVWDVPRDEPELATKTSRARSASPRASSAPASRSATRNTRAAVRHVPSLSGRCGRPFSEPDAPEG